jgi:polysaccharide chain length determinant protein (PEP-CTERM system associated)
MTELSEEQQPARPSFERYLDLVKRRHISFLMAVFLGWLFVWASSWVLPSRYKSSTLILVEQPTMPENYVASNVSENLQDRLQSITQQILSRTRLLTIIDKFQLYGGAGAPIDLDEKVEKMRKDITIELVRDSRNNEITAFRINYLAHDPRIAQQVTSELTGLLINENLKVREEQSEGTTKFIERQLEEARSSLSEQEAKVRQFESAHEGALPTQQASNLQILSGLQGQLQNEQDSLNTAKQQRVYYQTLIEQYRSLHSTTRSSEGGPAELPAIDQELNKLRAQLTELSSRYTDRYPDVLKLKAQIAKTERLRQELAAAPKNGTYQSSQSGPAVTSDSALQNSPLLQLQGQLQANQAEITNRERAVVGLQARIGEYQARLNEQPATEQQLAELTRGYEQSKANYDDLLKKKNQSAMATSMEQMQQGERFTMLDPPSLPEKPDFPNRLKFCGIGLAVGLGLGIVVVAGIEFFDDRLHAEEEIKALLPVALISEIPEIQSSSEELKSRRRVVWGWTMAVFVIATILAGSTVSYLHG